MSARVKGSGRSSTCLPLHAGPGACAGGLRLPAEQAGAAGDRARRPGFGNLLSFRADSGARDHGVNSGQLLEGFLVHVFLVIQGQVCVLLACNGWLHKLALLVVVKGALEVILGSGFRAP